MTHAIKRRSTLFLAAAALALAVACASRVTRSGATDTPAPIGGVSPAAFDSAAAWRHLEAQLAFGPRPPGTPAHTKLKEYLAAEMRKHTDEVILQEWTDPAIRLPLTNVIAKFPGRSAGPSVLLCAHWDTRPTADYDPSPANWAKPIPGANDGASGTAVLLELARVLKQNPPPVPVWLVFFDGEDYGPGTDRMFLGSRYFAQNQPDGTPRKGVLLDMIGDADLSVPKEQFSVRRAPTVVAEVWTAAERAGHEAYFPDRDGGAIQDDHLPLLDAGILCIDLIDFTYAPWHTLADTADKCSPRSLKVIGETMVAWIYAQK
jgi:hypothetical protein